ncbi:MAG: hypothetical protein ABIA37_03220 [Candidatus Woesearchaeota archaeon]
MEFTEQEKAVLKTLIKKEQEEIEKEGEKLMIVNSPFLSTVSRLQSKDLEFMKDVKLYQNFLEQLLRRL